MADCIPVRIAKAVAAEINAAVEAGDLSPEFTAVFSFASEITEFQSLNDDGLTVDVVPTSGQSVVPVSRELRRHDVRVAVGIRRRIDTSDRTIAGIVSSDAITVYVNLLYSILGMFAAGRPLSTEPNAAWDYGATTQITLYDPDMIAEGTYFGWVHLTFAMTERLP